MKIYLVSTGIYSDQEVIALFTSKQDAQDYCDMARLEWGRRPEMYGDLVVDDLLPELSKLRQGLRKFGVQMWSDGDIYEADYLDQSYTMNFDNLGWRFVMLSSGQRLLENRLWAGSLGDAIARTDTLRKSILAKGEWPNDNA